MRKLVYQADKFDTKDAHAVMLELEAELGINLSVKDAKNPNVVHGYVNTSSDSVVYHPVMGIDKDGLPVKISETVEQIPGSVEVYLYEQTDVTKIDAIPQYRTDEKLRLIKQREYTGIYRKCELLDGALRTGIESVLSKRGLTVKSITSEA